MDVLQSLLTTESEDLQKKFDRFTQVRCRLSLSPSSHFILLFLLLVSESECYVEVLLCVVCAAFHCTL